MSKYAIDKQTLTDIADVIRSVKGTNAPIFTNDFSAEIEGIGDTLRSVIEGSGVDVIIPNGTTTIKAYTFSGCTNLKSVTIPDTVISIGNTAFSWCSNLASITIPKSVTNIGSYAFTNCGCLVYDFSDHTNIPSLVDTTAFNAINASAKIIVPGLKYFTWITATNWADYKDNITYRDDDMPFTIYGINNVYTATKGMTWREWVNSVGHAFGYTLSGDGDSAGVIIPERITGSSIELWVTDTDSGSYVPVEANQLIKCTHYTGY